MESDGIAWNGIARDFTQAKREDGTPWVRRLNLELLPPQPSRIAGVKNKQREVHIGEKLK